MQFFIRLLVCIFFISSLLCGQVGYFCVPVADLIAQPFSKSEKYSVADLYDTISISPERGKDSCLRVHQGIFNEQATSLH
jgi:hypothetical protein